MNFISVHSKHITKFNSAHYIKIKLYTIYSAFFILFITLGFALGYLLKENTPSVVIDDMLLFFTPVVPDGKMIEVISSIIYNSIDIFKISIIIIISGFSYISKVLLRIIAATWSIWCGSAFFHYVTTATCKITNKSVVLAAITIILYCSTLVFDCVNTELMAQEFCSYHNSGKIFSFNLLWRYIGIFLISFGYILIIYTIYMYSFNLLK